MDTQETIMECIARVYKTPLDQIGLQTNIRDELSNKSMLMVALVSSIENELDVMIPIQETTQLRTVGNLVDRVKKDLDEQPS